VELKTLFVSYQPFDHKLMFADPSKYGYWGDFSNTLMQNVTVLLGKIRVWTDLNTRNNNLKFISNIRSTG